MLSHTEKQGCHCVQVLLCLPDPAGLLSMTEGQNPQWEGTATDGDSGLGEFLTTSGMTLFPITTLCGFDRKLVLESQDILVLSSNKFKSYTYASVLDYFYFIQLCIFFKQIQCLECLKRQNMESS